MEAGFSCPKCGSENTQKVELAYRLGASSGVNLSIGGVKLGKNAGLGGAITGTESLSLLSQGLKPPTRKTWFTSVLFFAASAYGAVYYPWAVSTQSTESFVWWLEAIMVLVALGSATSVKESFKFNRDQFPKLAKKWVSDFICLRCGERFEPR